jgi:transcriptional antiterminator NusG
MMDTVVEKINTMKWYIVRAQSNKERNVAERITNESLKGDLMGKVGRVLVPTENTFYMKNGKKVKREKVLYPGYIFVETNAIGELKYFLKGMNGASGFLTNRAGEILPLSEIEINRMIGQQETAKIEVETPFVVGEEVKIIDGPFSSMLGKIESINDQKVKLSVSIFGRITPVDLNIIQIDKKQ